MAPRPPQNRASSVGCHFYVREILAHAGLWTTEVPAGSLADGLAASDGFGVLLLAGDATLAAEDAGALRTWVATGGALVATGATWGLDDLLGVRPQAPPSGFAVGCWTLGEGYVGPARASHPILDGLRGPLHFFNGIAVEPGEATVLAEALDPHQRGTGHPAVTVRRVGSGVAILLAPDIPGAVAHIQQGRFIDQDGSPAPDGSAPVSDNVLKADDGIVLDWHLDRARAEGIPYPVFLEPAADGLRELLLRALFFAAREVGAELPLLWYYPRNLPALAHVSHDSDGNDPEAARAMLALTRELGIRDTWCIQKPGYPPELYQAMLQAGHEVALHFDALEQGPLSEWRESNLRAQHEWLTYASGVAAVSNKNHYTRWEGRLEFYRWCAALGIRCDQSRGPSKMGDCGFPFGTCHPYFAMEADGTAIDCLELGFLSQDFVVVGPATAIPRFVESVARAHGIAHVIFHPAHCQKPGVADALRAYVAECRRLGMEFWTCAEIDRWERARRQVGLERVDGGWRLASTEPMPGATLLSLGGTGTGNVRRHGFDFAVATADLEPGTAVTVAGP